MDVDLIFKIAAVGILVAVLNQLLVRSGREEQAMMTTLAGLVVVMMILVQEKGKSFKLAWMAFSVSMSTAEVVSSRIRMGGFTARARAGDPGGGALRDRGPAGTCPPPEQPGDHAFAGIGSGSGGFAGLSGATDGITAVSGTAGRAERCLPDAADAPL